MSSAGMLTVLCERWEEARGRGVDLSPEDLCRDHPELVEEVRRAVRHLAAAARLGDTPDGTADGSEADPWGPPPDPARAGLPALPPGCRYRLDRFLAQGGLGRVYVGRDLELGREVAVKFVRPDRAEAGAALVRFRREAEVTGRLEHPGVAPVYGLVGLAGGGFCYAMRLLQGETLAAAVDRAREAPAAARPAAVRRLLGHFVGVCNAVAFAHSRGVLHRDLKPQNVMLGGFGETWVLDWGLAKTVGDRPDPGPAAPAAAAPAGEGSTPSPGGGSTPDDVTHAGAAVGTPGFMSPEQLAGDWARVGPAADIYSLGATLGVILTGTPPPPWDPPGNWLAGAAGAPPALVAVCRKATAADPAGRYPSATELAAEVDRWLADEPVTAYRDPFRERARRWAKRRRTVVATAAAAVLVGLVGSAVGVAVVARKNRDLDEANTSLGTTNAKLTATNVKLDTARQEAEKQRDEADQSRKQQASVTQFLVTAFRRPDPAADGRKLTVAELLTLAEKELAADTTIDPPGRSALLHAIGQTYHGLGLPTDAVRAFEQVAVLRRRHLGPDHLDTLATEVSLGEAYHEAGHQRRALEHLEVAVQRLRTVAGSDHPDTLLAVNNLASKYREAGRIKEAVELHRQVVEKFRDRFGADNPTTLSMTMNLGAALSAAGQFTAAAELLSVVRQTLSQALGPNHFRTLYATDNLASAYQDLGKHDEAVPLRQQVLDARKEKFGPSHPLTLTSMGNLGNALLRAARPRDAIPLLEEAVERGETGSRPDHPGLLTTKSVLANAYGQVRQFDKAIPLFEAVLAKSVAKLGASHPQTCTTRNNLATTLQDTGRHERAIPLLEESVAASKAALGARHPETLAAMNNLAASYRDTNQPDKAIPLCEAVLDGARAVLPPKHPHLIAAQLSLANAYASARQHGKAAELLKQAVPAAEAAHGPDHPQTIAAMIYLAGAYTATSQPDKAVRLLENVLPRSRKRFGDRHLMTVNALAGLGTSRVRQGVFAEAEPPLREAVAARKEMMPGQWPYFSAQKFLGASLLGQKKYAEAEPFLRAGYDGLKQRQQRLPGHIVEYVAEAAERLAELYGAWEKPDEAARWRKTAEEERRKLPPKK